MKTGPRHRLLNAAGAAALLVAAALVWNLLPTKMQTWAPITVEAAMGERAQGRDLAVTVHTVESARSITFSQGGTPVQVPAKAVWLVIDLTYEPLVSANPRPTFELVTDGGRVYTTYLGSLGNDGVFESAGVPHRGVVAFELPAVPVQAELTVANKAEDRYENSLDAPLDSKIVVPLDLSKVTVADTVDLDAMGRT